MTEISDTPHATPARRHRSGVRTFLRGGVSMIVAGLVAGVTLLVVFTVMAASGFLPLSGFEGRISRSIEERLGPGWRVSASSALLQRADGRAAVRIRDVRIQHASGMSVRAPQAVLSYAPWALLRGRVSLTGIDLVGVNLRLGVDKDGALLLDAGDQQIRLPVPDQHVATGMPGVVALLAAVDLLAREGGELFALETARLSESRVTLVDADGREKTSLERVQIRMTPLDSATRRIDVAAQSESGPKDFSVQLRAVDENAREASVDVRRFQISDVVALVFGDSFRGFDGLALAGRIAVTTGRGANGRGDLAPRTHLDLSVSSGAIEIPGVKPVSLKVDAGRIELLHDGATGEAEIRHLDLQAGATDVRLTGRVVQKAGGGWSGEINGGGVVAGEGADAAVQVSRLEARLSGDAGAALRLDSLAVSGPQISVTASGVAQGALDQPGVTARLALGPSDLRAALALWPVFISPEVRAIIAARLPAGRLEQLDLALDFPAEVLRAARAGAVIPDESIKVTTRGTGLRFLIADGLPEVTDATATAISTGRTLLVESPSGKTMPEPGRVITFSEAAFVITDTYAPRAQGRATFRAQGGVDALASLLARPVLREFAPGQIDPAIIRGGFDLRNAITLPLAEDVKPDEIIVVSNGDMRNVSSDMLVPGEKLEGASFRATYERNALSLRGEGRLSAIPGQMDVRIDRRGLGEASFTAQIDQAARQKRGLALPGLTGPVQLKATKLISREKADAPLKVEIDLARAAIDGLLPGWSKPVGRAGRVSFLVGGDEDGIDLNEFVLDSAPVLLRGRVELDRQNALESAAFTTARLSPGDDLRVDIGFEGGVGKLTVRGRVLDARPFLKLDARDEKRSGDVDLDLSVPIVTGYNNEVLANAVIKAQRRQGEMRALSLEGKIGRAALTARIQRGQGPPQLLVESEDGGAFLRFYDVYRRAFGGSFILQTPVGEARGAGQLLYRDFIVRNEPALRRVLAEGQASSGIGGDRAVTGPRMTDTGDVAFTKLRAEFSRTPTRIDFRDIVIWGPLLGFTAQGNVDLARDRLDIAGTFVPSYAFNNAFSQVPIFGRILGGGQYEGLFAVNFRLAGSFAQPTMTINPLSAIAPGILRRFVDPGGGGSSLFDR